MHSSSLHLLRTDAPLPPPHPTSTSFTPPSDDGARSTSTYADLWRRWRTLAATGSSAPLLLAPSSLLSSYIGGQLPEPEMEVVGLVSGGKDNCFSMMWCLDYGHKVVALANFTPLDDTVDELNSYMYQTVRRAPDRGLLRRMHGAAPVPPPNQWIHKVSRPQDRNQVPSPHKFFVVFFGTREMAHQRAEGPCCCYSCARMGDGASGAGCGLSGFDLFNLRDYIGYNQLLCAFQDNFCPHFTIKVLSIDNFEFTTSP